MKVPAIPPVGHVIAYQYLWASQAATREDGAKTYPCAIVLAQETREGEPPIAYVVAISHTPPVKGRRTVSVPPKLKRHLGLDDLPSWVYVDELNVFSWPGPDIRPGDHLPRRPAAIDNVVIGQLPSDWFELLKQGVDAAYRQQQLSIQKRTG